MSTEVLINQPSIIPAEGARSPRGMDFWRNRAATVLATAIAVWGAESVIVPVMASAQDQPPTPPTEQCDTGWQYQGTNPEGQETWICPDPAPSPSQPVQPAPHKPKPHHKPHRQNGTIFDYYRNPLRDVHHNGGRVFASRIDEGVDYHGEGPVHPIGLAVIRLVARGSSSFWAHQGGKVVVYELENGPAAHKRVFTSENCTPAGNIQPGKVVHTYDTICYARDKAPYIEIGWAMPGKSSYSKDHPAAWPFYTPAGNPDGSKTAYGVNFSHLMGLLGAPEGNTNPGASYNSTTSRTVGRIPASYPSWHSARAA